MSDCLHCTKTVTERVIKTVKRSVGSESSKMSDCLQCTKTVTSRQHAVQCDGCDKWQHRLCQTGISLAEYRLMARGQVDTEWMCTLCKEGIERVCLDEGETRGRNEGEKGGDGERGGANEDFSIGIERWLNEEEGAAERDDTIDGFFEPPAASTLLDVPRSPGSPVPTDPQPRLNEEEGAAGRDDTIDGFFEPPAASTLLDVPRSPGSPVPTDPQSRLNEEEGAAGRDDTIDGFFEPPAASTLLDVPRSPGSPVPTDPQPRLNEEEGAAGGDDVFEVIVGGSRNGKDQVVDSRGFCYNLKRNVQRGRDWQCTSRKQNYCKATVQERDGKFTFGKQQHCHEGEPGIAIAKKIVKKVKADSLANVFRSAGKIAETALYTMADPEMPPATRPNLNHLHRLANRARERCRPCEPRNCDFEIAQPYMPEHFMRADIKGSGQRHIIFATAEQLEVLANARTWYIDGTFKVVREPFHQLFTIHGFLGDDEKQVPLVFCLMSRRKTSDYEKVFSSVLEMLPRRAVVSTVVSDFEKAAWTAVRRCLPGIDIQGCYFHWTQALWRRVQEAGLQVKNSREKSTRDLVKLVLALPFLPSEHIGAAFLDLRRTATADDSIQTFLNYVQNQWILNNFFPVETWSVFRKQIRTNNDCEGWHHRMNDDAPNAKLPFYTLVPLLFKEADKLPMQQVLVAEGKLKRSQRAVVRERQLSYNRLWCALERGLLNKKDFLLEIVKVGQETE